MMITILWGAASAVVGLLWFMVETMAHRIQAGHSIETPILWLVLTPIAAVGAMVMLRRDGSFVTYGSAVRTGVVASLWSAGFLLIVWVLVTTVFVPEYLSFKEEGMTMTVLRSGENIQQLAHRIKFTRMVYSPPMLYVLSVLLPLASGIVTSIIAAIGLRTKRASQP